MHLLLVVSCVLRVPDDVLGACTSTHLTVPCRPAVCDYSSNAQMPAGNECLTVQAMQRGRA